MSRRSQLMPSEYQAWHWPVNLTKYDLTPSFSAEEQEELDRLFPDGELPSQIRCTTRDRLQRLLRPITDVLTYINASPYNFYETMRVVVIEMHHHQKPFWIWTISEWKESLCENRALFAHRYGRRENQNHCRPLLMLLSYFFCPSSALDSLIASTPLLPLARKVFGQETIDEATQRLLTVLRSWGYCQRDRSGFTSCVCYLLLKNHHPALSQLTLSLLEEVAHSCTLPRIQKSLFQISRALCALGVIPHPLPDPRSVLKQARRTNDGSLSDEWFSWCERWHKHTTLQQRETIYSNVIRIGRWLQATHSEVTTPGLWSYELAAEFVAAVMDLKCGDWASSLGLSFIPVEKIGMPLRPHAKVAIIRSMRTFLRDCQEWEWIPQRLNPGRALRVPSSLHYLTGPDPKAVDREKWAKILWAAMNLEAKDLPISNTGMPIYPLEMVRAVAAVWCFGALRANEIRRLRLGCIRWQYEDVMIPETGEILPHDTTCFLDIPVTKTSMSYTKPVHPLVGKRVAEWARVRPQEQPRDLDRKMSESVQFLFAYRGSRISTNYINEALIPLLCRRAGIPEADSRGAITSHRARATIASMLYNAREPLSIYELKEYLGHKYLSSTQSYLKIDPTHLATKVAKAGYLEQNLATVEVLLDQEAIMNGAASRGEVWKYYDLGHGFCTNPFWAHCAHRMACARCPFYRPKDSLKEQLVEGKANLVHMLEFVSLTEDEKVLVTEGVELHQELIERLADVPTPAGPTPRELEAEHKKETKVIPLKSVRRTKNQKSSEP